MQSSVQTAYEELRYARARTYLPILMERRTKDLLPPFSGLDRRESQWNRERSTLARHSLAACRACAGGPDAGLPPRGGGCSAEVVALVQVFDEARP